MEALYSAHLVAAGGRLLHAREMGSTRGRLWAAYRLLSFSKGREGPAGASLNLVSASDGNEVCWGCIDRYLVLMFSSPASPFFCFKRTYKSGFCPAELSQSGGFGLCLLQFSF